MLNWLDLLHGDTIGWIEIFARTADRLDVETAWFAWPQERGAALSHVMERYRTHDVWASCLLKSQKRRGTEIAGRYAWCDADTGKLTPDADAQIAELQPIVVWSGSPGNRQLWVPLTTTTAPAEMRRICKRLIARIGGDPKHSPDSVMRIPGTLNHKACEDGTHRCRPVLAQAGTSTTWDSGALLFGAPPELTEDTSAASGLPDPIEIDPVPAKLRKALRSPAADPSEHTQHVAYVAAELFPEDGKVLAALELDEVTTLRRNDRKHDQPGWWASEFARVLAVARSKYPQEQAGKNQSAQLRQMAIASYEFGRADDGEPFALPREGPRVVRMLRGDKYSLRAELSDEYAGIHGGPPGNGALADALMSLEGLAQRTGIETPLPLRVARHEDSLVLDLGDPTGQAVLIRPGSWEVVGSSPVLFRRTRLTAPLPIPQRGKRLTDTLFPLINVPREDWSLMAAFLVSSLWPDIPHPIPLLTGGEGVAKTSTTRMLRSLIDPSTVPTRGRPDEKDWDVALSAQWVVALDNLSDIKPWLSDALCRAVTGEGTVRRKLYTDLDMAMISARRVMMLNGISATPTNADLAGRTIMFELEAITAYRDEADLTREWDKARPYALGAILDQAAMVLARMHQTPMTASFRMADFARILATMDQINGTRGLEAYRSRLEDAAQDVINQDEVAVAIQRWAATLTEPWEGMLMELSETLIRHQGGKPAAWPKNNANVWVNKIRRIANPLRRAGIVVVQGQRTKRGQQYKVTRDDLA